MKPFRAAIVGTGNIARSHMNALRHEQERVEVVAAVDVSPGNLQTFCEEHGITHGYADLQTMLDEQKPNLVHICTPPGVHADLIVQTLRAGAQEHGFEAASVQRQAEDGRAWLATGRARFPGGAQA